MRLFANEIHDNDFLFIISIQNRTNINQPQGLSLQTIEKSHHLKAIVRKFCYEAFFTYTRTHEKCSAYMLRVDVERTK